MADKPLAPPERLEMLWFDLPDGRMTYLKEIPEFMAHDCIALMEKQGYRFVQLGSSQLPEKKEN